MSTSLERQEIERQLLHLIKWWVTSISEQEVGVSNIDIQRERLVYEIMTICFPKGKKGKA
jgi:hypothetical protein